MTGVQTCALPIFIAVAESPKSIGEVINLGSGRAVTIGETAKKILSLTESAARIVCETKRVRPEKSEVFKLICDNRKARRLLGWGPKHTLETGLKATVAHVSARRADYKDALYIV